MSFRIIKKLHTLKLQYIPNRLLSTSITKMDLKELRIKYKSKHEAFTEDQIKVKEPFVLFKEWMQVILSDKDIIEPNAVSLSTATKDGIPSCRFVLLKEFNKEDGFKFFTNCNSRKGIELKENPNAAMTFYWAKYNRQIRIEGHVEKLSDEESTSYFLSRPYPSQIGAMASNQSSPIPNRDYLTNRGEELQNQFPSKELIKKPPEWGGFRLIPKSIEFWQGQSDRMHDRIRFRRPQKNDKIDGVLLHQAEEGWVYERLAP